MNKKVALLTFHNAANYGAVLQTYALQRYLQTIGIDAEYINYVNLTRQHMYDMRYLFRQALSKHDYFRAVRLLFGSLFMMRRQKAFRQFSKDYIKVTPELYTTSQQAETLNGRYDKFLIGSDQVWDPEHNGSDLAYLLDFVHDDSRKATYSPSFGITQIPPHLLAQYKKLLTSIPALATREASGVQLIKQLTGRDAVLNLDPVFLLSNTEWATLHRKRIHDLYVFTYTNAPGQFERFLRITHFPMDGFKQYLLTSSTQPADFLNPRKRVMFSMSPNEFLSIIDGASLIVTASFHCLAFAIIYHKPFIAILTGDEGKDHRLLNLLQITGLTDRILTDNLTLEQVYKLIDYAEVDRRLHTHIIASRQYLINTLNP